MPFDIGFLELCVIAVIGLLVLGPERLPVAARSIGRWIGKARRAFTGFKNEVNRELQIDELKRQMAEQQQKMDTILNANPLEESTTKQETAEELQAKIDQTRADFDSALGEPQGPSDEAIAAADEEAEMSGCENPVEYEPLPRESENTIHTPEPASESSTDNASQETNKS